MGMENCCEIAPGPGDPCPECGRAGRKVERITLKALLRPAARERLSPGRHRFCATASCGIVYFGDGGAFRVQDVRARVFQKEPAGGRTVCYCLGVDEDTIRREIEASGRSASAERITALVQAERCACEVRNPQGTCCLGNVTNIAKRADTVVALR